MKKIITNPDYYNWNSGTPPEYGKYEVKIVRQLSNSIQESTTYETFNGSSWSSPFLYSKSIISLNWRRVKTNNDIIYERT